MAKITISKGWYVLDQDIGFIAVDTTENLPTWLKNCDIRLATRCRIIVEEIKDSKGRPIRQTIPR